MQRGSLLLAEDSGRAHDADFDRLYREEHNAVERHLVYLTDDRALAEDLAQEAFGRLYQRMTTPGEEPLRNAHAWLLTVASNLAYNHFRAQGRRTAREDAVAAVKRTSTGDIDAVLDVRAALATLGARDRTVLLLRHGGFSYSEIAETVGLASSSIGTILARAQERFRIAYEAAAHSGENKE